MRHKTYGELVNELGLEYCRGIDKNGFYCGFNSEDHVIGRHEPGKVHFTDKPVTWPGVHRALKLAALAQTPAIDEQPTWRRVYMLNVAARTLGNSVHVRVPARHIRFDRRFVLAGVAGIPNTVTMRRDAFNWARKDAR